MSKVILGGLLIICLAEGFALYAIYQLLETVRSVAEVGRNLLDCVERGDVYLAQHADDNGNKILLECYSRDQIDGLNTKYD